MSVDDSADAVEGLNLAPVGTDFESDLKRVGLTVSAALDESDEGRSEAIESMIDHVESENIPPADAVVAAWFLILDISASNTNR